MIEKIAVTLAEEMSRERIINEKCKEHYVYALIGIVEKTITIGTIFAISSMIQIVIPTILFLFFFFELRKRTGGYHSKSFLQCYLMTIGAYLLSIIVSYIFVNCSWLRNFLLILAAFLIEVIGAVNHPNMSMNLDEFKKTKQAARLVLILEIITIATCNIIGLSPICIGFMASAIILCGISLCIAKFIKQEVKFETESS